MIESGKFQGGILISEIALNMKLQRESYSLAALTFFLQISKSTVAEMKLHYRMFKANQIREEE